MIQKLSKERLEEIKQIKESINKEFKNKKFTALTRKEKDALLETVAKMLGLI